MFVVFGTEETRRPPLTAMRSEGRVWCSDVVQAIMPERKIRGAESSDETRDLWWTWDYRVDED